MRVVYEQTMFEKISVLIVSAGTRKIEKILLTKGEMKSLRDEFAKSMYYSGPNSVLDLTQPIYVRGVRCEVEP